MLCRNARLSSRRCAPSPAGTLARYRSCCGSRLSLLLFRLGCVFGCDCINPNRWVRQNVSDRIWQHRRVLIFTLSTNLTVLRTVLLNCVLHKTTFCDGHFENFWFVVRKAQNLVGCDLECGMENVEWRIESATIGGCVTSLENHPFAFFLSCFCAGRNLSSCRLLVVLLF